MFIDFVLCCQDYGMKHILGNLIKQSCKEILEGEEFKKFINGLNDNSIDIRRFIRKSELEKALTNIGFELIVSIEDINFAPFGNENPQVIRIVTEKTKASLF